jgi:anti-sigma regulatory factor (Ser/Thr protein kinase)
VVRDALGEVHGGDWPLDDGLLVASELVTNAVRHSGCEPDHRLRVDVKLGQDRLLISVHDPGLSGRGARPRFDVGESDSPEPGGWGLRIVEQIARRWGAERPDGYRVWAELALAS